jgi:GNAT superfamily N-acetyltransferase
MTLPLLCVCGWAIPGADAEARVAAFKAHVDQLHAEYKLQDHDLRDYLDALERLDAPHARFDQIGRIEVNQVSPGRIPDFLDFFDHKAFADYPIWAACYCMAHHVAGPPDDEWAERTAAQNRSDMIGRLEAQSTIGYLAYVDGKTAGWCNASSLDSFPLYNQDGNGREHAAAIACFVVASPYRRHGIATALLAAALDGCRQRGFKTVEAYPVRNPRSDSHAYHGPLQLYLDAGFEEVEEKERWVVVRKRLE